MGESPKPKITVEHRAGKAITVVSGLHTYGERTLNQIAKDLKNMFGTGGTVKNGKIEIQGERVQEISEYFETPLR